MKILFEVKYIYFLELRYRGLDESEILRVEIFQSEVKAQKLRWFWGVIKVKLIWNNGEMK